MKFGEKKTYMISEDQIIVKNLRIKGKLGPDAWIYPKEQFLIFNIIGTVNQFKNSDEIGDTISYSQIATHLEKFIENQESTYCLQNLAAKVAYDCLKIFGLEGVTVKIEKQHALLQANSVGIEIKRCQKDIEKLKKYQMNVFMDPWNTLVEDCITISNMLVYCIIGVNDCERLEKQKVLISLKLYFPPSDTDKSRNNYRFISSMVFKFIEKSSYKTLEKLAIDLCDLILKNGKTSKINVYIEKPFALRLADSSGVQITRQCPSYDIQQCTHLQRKISEKCVAYLGVGTNLGDRLLRIHQALSLLKKKNIRILDTSFLYETAPMYVTEQPSFLNGCLKIETILAPLDLLAILKDIEHELGRDFTAIRNGPRVIDLDIIFYENLSFRSDTLIIPHPRMQERLFVLMPLADIADHYEHPSLYRNVQELLDLLLVKDRSKITKVFPVGNGILWDLNEKTFVMGILNTTPDSFSDGGEAIGVESAVAKAKMMIEAGADIIDIGGQSTAPNAPEIAIDVEIDRVIPVIKRLRASFPDLIISVDTFREPVARAALEVGANYVNDVSGGERDPNMIPFMVEKNIPVCLMHMRGTSATMQTLTNYDGDLMDTIRKELYDSLKKAIDAGVYRWNIFIDPGIGFAKTFEQNYEILKRLPELNCSSCDLRGFPILIGVSRKKFLGKTTMEPVASHRIMGTAAANAIAIVGGASIIRVHDVKEMRQVAQVLDACYKQ